MKTEQAKTYSGQEVKEIIEMAIRQDREFICQLLRALPRQIDDVEVKQRLIEDPGRLRKLLGGLNSPEHTSKLICNWREQDGVIYLSVTSDGTTGPEWIKRLEKKGFRLSDYAKSMLCSQNFKPTSGVTTEIAILKGILFEDNDRIAQKIRAEADKRKLLKPNAEVACFIREKFSDEDIKAMGLTWVIIIHEPIISGGGLRLLGVNRDDHGRWLLAYFDEPDGIWLRENGFAFVVSQVQN